MYLLDNWFTVCSQKLQISTEQTQMRVSKYLPIKHDFDSYQMWRILWLTGIWILQSCIWSRLHSDSYKRTSKQRGWAFISLPYPYTACVLYLCLFWEDYLHAPLRVTHHLDRRWPWVGRGARLILLGQWIACARVTTNPTLLSNNVITWWKDTHSRCIWAEQSRDLIGEDTVRDRLSLQRVSLL